MSATAEYPTYLQLEDFVYSGDLPLGISGELKRVFEDLSQIIGHRDETIDGAQELEQDLRAALEALREIQSLAKDVLVSE